MWRLFGKDVAFPIGVPASVLTATADWVGYYARCGFNVLTYKTVRSQAWAAHEDPNWVFLNNLNAPLSLTDDLPVAVGDKLTWPANPKSFSMANSFGVPSFAPDKWQPDVKEAHRRLNANQLLIVSVMGCYEKYQDEAMVEDFALVAHLAEEAGARIIGLNVSCPNSVDPQTKTVKNALCELLEDTTRIVDAVRNKISSDTQLILKLAYMDREALNRVVVPLVADGRVQAISGINTLQMKVDRPTDGKPAFTGRDKAGVSGTAIRNYGLQFVRWLSDIRAQNKLSFDIIGMGGVMTAEDVFDYQRAGATVVQTATGAFFNSMFHLALARGLKDDPLAALEQTIGLVEGVQRRRRASSPPCR